jgi:hypothetical protein
MAQEIVDRPTDTEIRNIEAKVRLPHGAATLGKYVRYYYASAKAGVRHVSGIYIERSLFKPSETPVTGIVVVGREAEIPVPSDAECSVLFVTADPQSSARVLAECSAGLFQK